MPRFETLIERYHDEIFHYLWYMLRDSRLDAADVAQETWLRAWQAYDRLRRDSNVRAWLYRIATNCALTALGRHRREVPLADHMDLPATEGLPEETLEPAALLELAIARIGELPPRQRAAVLLRYGREMRYGELARIMKCSEESARANVSLGIRRLRRELRET